MHDRFIDLPEGFSKPEDEILMSRMTEAELLFEDKSVQWMDGYFAKAEEHGDIYYECPYDDVTQWKSAMDWHAGYLYREEEIKGG